MDSYYFDFGGGISVEREAGEVSVLRPAEMGRTSYKQALEMSLIDAADRLAAERERCVTLCRTTAEYFARRRDGKEPADIELANALHGIADRMKQG